MRTVVVVLVLAVALGIATAWLFQHPGSCYSGIDLETGRRFGGCTYETWNTEAGVVIFALSFVLLLPLARLIRRRRIRRRSPPTFVP